MADFSQQCSVENFGEDFGDLANLRPGETLEPEHGWSALCEGCGSAIVDNDGKCIALNCMKKHGMPPALFTRMRALADTGHARADELRHAADDFEADAAGFYADPQTVEAKSFLGSFARARKLWCDITGEPLI